MGMRLALSRPERSTIRFVSSLTLPFSFTVSNYMTANFPMQMNQEKGAGF
jgi:hypothetical protein